MSASRYLPMEINSSFSRGGSNGRWGSQVPWQEVPAGVQRQDRLHARGWTRILQGRNREKKIDWLREVFIKNGYSKIFNLKKKRSGGRPSAYSAESSPIWSLWFNFFSIYFFLLVWSFYFFCPTSLNLYNALFVKVGGQEEGGRENLWVTKERGNTNITALLINLDQI